MIGNPNFFEKHSDELKEEYQKYATTMGKNYRRTVTGLITGLGLTVLPLYFPLNPYRQAWQTDQDLAVAESHIREAETELSDEQRQSLNSALERVTSLRQEIEESPEFVAYQDYQSTKVGRAIPGMILAFGSLLYGLAVTNYKKYQHRGRVKEIEEKLMREMKESQSGSYS